MSLITDQQYGQISTSTWDELLSHQWECFRIIKYETGSHFSYVQLLQTMTELEVKSHIKEITPIIFITHSELLVDTITSDRDYGIRMIEYLPHFERPSPQLINLLAYYDGELKRIEASRKIIENNLFFDTAVELLPLYQRDINLGTPTTMAFDKRRELIQSKYKGTFAQTTRQTLFDICNSFSQSEVTIENNITPGVYDITFVNELGAPSNIDGIRKSIADILPAHLVVNYIMIYNTWEWANGYTWGGIELDENNWHEFRTRRDD